MVMMDVVMAQVVMVDVAIPMFCHVVRMVNEGSARAVAEHLPVAEAAAPALRPARGMRGAAMRVPGAAMRM